MRTHIARKTKSTNENGPQMIKRFEGLFVSLVTFCQLADVFVNRADFLATLLSAG